MALHSHESLPAGDNIRILVLQTGPLESPLIGSLKIASSSQRPEYYALSYVWGEPTSSHSIRVDGRLKAVNDLLYDALQDIRHTRGDNLKANPFVGRCHLH